MLNSMAEGRERFLPAQGLRPFPERLIAKQVGWRLALPPGLAASPEPPPVIVAIGGGKGGVGKSLVSANLAARFAQAGLKVIAVDLDVGGANLHTYFGLQCPRHGLADVLGCGPAALAEATLATPVAGVRLLGPGRDDIWEAITLAPGAVDDVGVGNESADAAGALRRPTETLARMMELLLAARGVGLADIVVLDLGAGSHRHTIDFFSAAHLGVITVLPEPTAIENAYLFLKTLLFRLIHNVSVNLGQRPAGARVRAALTRPEAASERGRLGGYADRLNALSAEEASLVKEIRRALASRIIGIAVNQGREQKDIDVGKSMEIISQRYFGFDARVLACLNYDEAAWKSLRNRRLLTTDFPHCILSRRLSDMARAMLVGLGY